ncbi:MAG: ATP-dependent DNA helicase RecG [Candidatus Pacebacteria bacterium]|nr:ATP-dependent DNA helicase RecG [Candidatus Paceibacterota bacterium]
MSPDDLVTKHFARLRADQKAALARLNVFTIRDLLYHFPARYESAGPTGTISGATPGTDVTLYGTIRKPETRKAWKSRRPIAEATLEDASGKIKIMWFNQPYIAKTLADGMVVRATGRMAGTADKPYLANPEIDRSPIPPEDVHDTLFASAKAFEDQTLFAIYPESKGVSSLWFLHALKKLFEAHVHETIQDPIPEAILEKYNLPTLSTALVWMHAPKTSENAAAARKRFAFEEVFVLQLALAESRREAAREKALPVTVNREALADFVKSFPFPPTEAQQNAINDIIDDFEKPQPMRRLLEGDVGSGKTAVAAATAYLVATSRPPKQTASGKTVLREGGTLQVAYMCPTEILAKQHFATFVSYFKDHPIQIGLITGSECRKFPSKINRELSTKISRAQFRKWVANGEIPIVIGTHALIQKSLEFKTLAYAIIDEQHRFGKVARHHLAQKNGLSPHLLSMTATPIPRTLALTIYGDLDLSLLDQMPLGRKPIITEVLGPEKRELAYERVRKEMKEGRQVYVICPRIDEPDPTKELAIQAKSVKAEAERLRKEVFPDAAIDILHSKMTPIEKEDAMNRFEKGETDILVATSVVEVGVNVPNATVILIEGAERFGLSQLHQLRGRVIRSNHQAYCFVLPEKLGTATKDRLKALVTAKNGFELAEYDLALRGAGEFYGAKQWGISDITMEAIKNLKLVEAARTESARLMKSDPTLDEHPLLKQLLASKTERIHIE